MSVPALPRFELTPRRWATFIAHAFKATVKQHHQDLIPAFSGLIPRDGVVFDVGAHAGQFAKLFARLAPEGVVYSFEPGRYARMVLMLALALNRAGNVRIFPFGLSDRPARLELRLPIKKSGSFGFGLGHLGPKGSDTRDQITETVDLVTLDGFVAAFPLERLDLIKADIEGWEMRMMAGGVETLKRFKPTLWLELVDGHLKRAGDSVASFWSFLEGLGYKPFLARADGGFTPLETPREGDIVWRYQGI